MSPVFLAGLVALAALVPAVLWVGSRGHGHRGERPGQPALSVHQERYAELEAERQRGALSPGAYRVALQELERAVLEDTGGTAPDTDGAGVRAATSLGVSLVAVVVALGLYLQIGQPVAWQNLTWIERLLDVRASEGELIVAERALQSHLEHTPAALPAWYLLARRQLDAGRFEEALSTLSVLATLEAEPTALAQVLAQRAQARYLLAGQQVDPAVRDDTLRALELDPGQPTALGLVGIDAFGHLDYRAAIQAWQLALARSGGASADALRAGIAEARLRLGESSGPAQARLEGAVAPPLNLPNPKEGVLFVFLRSDTGGMPLAAERVAVSGWPARIQLGPEDSIGGQAWPVAGQAVRVVARWSPAGEATDRSGPEASAALVLEPGLQAVHLSWGSEAPAP